MTMQNWLGLNRSHLTEVQQNHFLHSDVVEPFMALQASAQKSGVDLQLFSSFRDFDKQCNIWDRKWNGELPILSADNKPIDISQISDVEKMHAIMRWSALPGASRHHWGTDFDVYDASAVKQYDQVFQLIDEEYSGNGPCADLSQWLDTYAEQFGFYRPYGRYTGGIGAEPWHISFRELAEHISGQFDKQQLLQLIHATPLAGKQTLLQHFDEIYYRYVLNQGIPKL